MLKDTWKEKAAIGDIAEKEMQEFFTNEGIAHKVIQPKVNGYYNKEQHKGDILLTKTGTYIEVKYDADSSKYNNLYFEIAELYTDDYKYNNKARTIETVGFPQKACNAPVIFVHKVAEDRYFVYSATMLLKYALKGNDSALTWKSTKATDQYSKQKLALLLKGYKEAYKNNTKGIREVLFYTDKANLIKTLSRVYKLSKNDKLETVNPLLELVNTYNQYWNFKEYGWEVYDYSVRGVKLAPAKPAGSHNKANITPPSTKTQEFVF